MSAFRKRQHAMMEEHYNRFNCEHRLVVPRRRKIKGSADEYVNQCLRCGQALGEPIPPSEVQARTGGQKTEMFNMKIKRKWDTTKETDLERTLVRIHGHKGKRSTFFDDWYSEYLQSPAWRARREQVLNRARFQCEGCGDAHATQVHHSTYVHVGEEFLFELVALCERCHIRLHRVGK